MRDPIGVCPRSGRPGITEAQSGRHHHPRRAGDRLSLPSISLGPGIGEKTPSVEIKNAEYSKAQKYQTPSNPPERSYYCNDCLGKSANHDMPNDCRERLSNAQGPKVTNLRSLFETLSKPGLKAPKPQNFPYISPTKQAHLGANEELDGKSVDEKRAVGVRIEAALEDHEKGPTADVKSKSSDERPVDHAPKPEFNRASEKDVHGAKPDGTSKNGTPVKPQEKLLDPPIKSDLERGALIHMDLPVRTRVEVAGQKVVQIATHSARVEKRVVEKEDDELEPVVSKKTKRRIKITRDSAQSTIVVEETTKTPQSNLSVNSSPSHFQESKYTNIDIRTFKFVSRVEATNSSSPFVQLLEGQPEITLEAQQTNADPVQFASALETFNAIIPGCDAMQRFETMQYRQPFRCLANTKAKDKFDVCKWSGSKCYSKLEHADTQLIRRLLLELERTNIYTNGEECITMVEDLASEAICYHHKELARMLFQSRVREQLGRQVQEQVVVYKPVIVKSDSEFEIDWWLRPPPHGAMHYIPKYRSFSDPGAVSREIKDSIRDQARQPLITETTRSDDGLTKHDETQDGYLYVYWNRASFGHLKIGFTGIDVEKRLEKWEEQCHHIAEKRYQSPQRIKHAARVEKLIHTEFENHRVCEPACRGCGKMHIEWFRNLNLEFAIRRIEAWSAWIDKGPYERRGGAWRLKEDPEFELPLPLPIRTEEPQTPKKTRSPRSTSASPRQVSRPRRAREHSPSPQLQRQVSSLLDFFAAQTERPASAGNATSTLSATTAE